MHFSKKKLAPLAMLLAVLVVNAAALWPELSISRVDLNDNVLHFTLVERMAQAVEHGENPLDFWSSEWSLGYPVLRTYQPLAHALVVLAYFALGKSVGLMTVFVWVRFLSIVLLPLSFFAAARLMGLRPFTAAATAMLAPLVSTNFLYGIEYNSYTWAGSGLFPQAVGSHLLLIALGLAFRAVRRGRNLALAGAILGLTFLAHMIYGYMGAISICLLAAIPDARLPRGLRARRVAMVGAVALLVSAFQLAPLLLDGFNINHSRWESTWKWDSFGAWPALKWLFTGDLLDFGRLPAMTLLAFGGAALLLWNWRRRRPTSAAHAYLVWGAAFWTLVFFGRNFWGPLLTMLGVSSDMQLHRVIGGAQIFLVLLAAIGLSALWRESTRRWHIAAAAALTVLLFYPMVRERAHVLSNDAGWGAKNLAAYAADRDSIESVLATVKQRGGRAYAGLPAQWGGGFKVGDVPFYAFFSAANIPSVAFLYHSMALTSDIMVRFNEGNPFDYRLFNIRTVVAPVVMPADAPQLPPFLTPLGQTGRFRMFAAPGDSYFDVVDVLAAVKTTRNNFYDINDRWLQSGWVAERAYLRLDWANDVKPAIFRLQPEDPMPALPPLPSPGAVSGEQQSGEIYSAQFDVARPSYALFKMTWHPRWQAFVDGRPQKTIMLSPGFVGVPMAKGRHSLTMRYQPESWKAALFFAGFAGTLLLLVMDRRGRLVRVETRMETRMQARMQAWSPAWPSRWAVPGIARRRILIAGGLILLALPVCIPLFTGSVLWGHDAFEYFPRLEELHQNITHGVLIPRWAPDLGSGTGQPLFLFHPPMIYYFGEFWHLLGFDVVTAMNLACVIVVLLSAVGMYLLANVYFGEAGAWLAAAAYLYAPYFAVDLYIRSAMEEFSAFPFFALSLFGFAAYAKSRRLGYWLAGAAAYAGVLCCHFMAALLFTPLLLGFLGLTAWMEKSWNVLWKQAGGFLLGLGLSAAIWAPAFDSRQYAAINRAIEGYFLYSNHFVYLHQLFYSPWGYGTSVPGPNDGMSFALGWSHLLLVAVVWFWLSRHPKPGGSGLLRFFAVAAVLLCVLMLEDALWFWQQVPLLQYVNLPWRLLGPVTVCLAMLIAPLGPLLDSVPRWRKLGMAAAMALLIVPNLSHLHTGRLTDVDLTFWTPQRLAMSGFETTTTREVTPRWIASPPAYTPAAAKVIAGDAVIRDPARTPLYWSSAMKVKAPSTIEMQTAWFPGWKVKLDGQAIPAGPDMTGLIAFQVPAGEHFVEVAYGRTGLEKTAAGVSLASLILGIVLGVKKRFPQRSKDRKES